MDILAVGGIMYPKTLHKTILFIDHGKNTKTIRRIARVSFIYFAAPKIDPRKMR